MLNNEFRIARRQCVKNGADGARLFNKFDQVGTAALFARCHCQHGFAQPRLYQVIFQRTLIFQIGFRALPLDFIKRRLGDIEIAALNNFRHLAVEKGQEQCADMRAINIGIGHDDDFVIAQLFDIEIFAANARAERGN